MMIIVIFTVIASFFIGFKFGFNIALMDLCDSCENSNEKKEKSRDEPLQ